MALIHCKECNAQISSEAKACPHCGAKVKKPSGCLKWGGIFFIIIIVASMFGKAPDSTTTEPEVALTPEQQHQKRIEKGFSSWDGSHKQLEKFIKQNMHDPDSYEHVKTTYIDTGKALIIETTYRGKNGFGGLVINKTNAMADYDGNVTEIIK